MPKTRQHVAQLVPIGNMGTVATRMPPQMQRQPERQFPDPVQYAVPAPIKGIRPSRAGKSAGKQLGMIPNASYQPDAEDLKKKRQIESQFAKHRVQLREAQGDPGEKSMMIVYQALMDMLLSLIPEAEEKYREGRAERAAYALNVYINQVREIQNDMRSLHDFSNTGFRIVEILSHNLTLIAQNLIAEKGMMMQELQLKLSPVDRQAVESALHAMIQNQGRFISESLKSLRDQIMAQFVAPIPQGRGGRSTVLRRN